ncbi:hypothetical protein DFQ29_001780 [Apophysomyces sp. BC1021]|nr:hypothetical protein DFQ29_001780 [Apophysomyces sp. BC1021]
MMLNSRAIPIQTLLRVGSGLVGLYGLRRYFAGGWNYTKKDMSGKVVIVTGANDGIGKETAIDLAKRNATVVLACRDSVKSREALVEIRNRSNSDKVILETIDLSDLSSVRHFAKRFIASQRPLHVLINNASLMAPDRQTTKDGFELQFGTNYLGPFLLTELLLPTLKASSPGRIINVTSFAVHSAIINFDDIQSEKNYNMLDAYGQTKLANVLHANYLNRMLAGTGVTAYSCNPGSVVTTMLKDLVSNIMRFKFFCMLARPLMHFVLKSPKEGAQTTLYLATSDEVEGKGGGYWSDCKLKTTKESVHDVELQDRLYQYSFQAVHSKMLK